MDIVDKKLQFIGGIVLPILFSLTLTLLLYLSLEITHEVILIFILSYICFAMFFYLFYLTIHSLFAEYDIFRPKNYFNISSIVFSYEIIKEIGEKFRFSLNEIICLSYILYLYNKIDSTINDYNDIDLRTFIKENPIIFKELKEKWKMDTNELIALINNCTKEKIEFIVDKFYIREKFITNTLSELSNKHPTEIETILNEVRKKVYNHTDN